MNFAKSWMFNHPVTRRVLDGYFENDGIRQHYVTLGEGKLVVLIHGFPEFWYSWRAAAVDRHAEGVEQGKAIRPRADLELLERPRLARLDGLAALDLHVAQVLDAAEVDEVARLVEALLDRRQ